MFRKERSQLRRHLFQPLEWRETSQNHAAACSQNGTRWTQIHLCIGNPTLARYCCDGAIEAERRHSCGVSRQV